MKARSQMFTWNEVNFGEWGNPQQVGWLRPVFKDWLICSNRDKMQTFFLHL